MLSEAMKNVVGVVFCAASVVPGILCLRRGGEDAEEVLPRTEGFMVESVGNAAQSRNVQPNCSTTRAP